MISDSPSTAAVASNSLSLMPGMLSTLIDLSLLLTRLPPSFYLRAEGAKCSVGERIGLACFGRGRRDLFLRVVVALCCGGSRAGAAARGRGLGLDRMRQRFPRGGISRTGLGHTGGGGHRGRFVAGWTSDGRLDRGRRPGGLDRRRQLVGRRRRGCGRR